MLKYIKRNLVCFKYSSATELDLNKRIIKSVKNSKIGTKKLQQIRNEEQKKLQKNNDESNCLRKKVETMQHNIKNIFELKNKSIKGKKTRSEERHVGKECRIGCRSRWSP